MLGVILTPSPVSVLHQKEEPLDTLELADHYLSVKSPHWSPATTVNKHYHLLHFGEACPELPSEPEPIEKFLATVPNLLYRYNHWCSIRQFYAWLERRKGILNPCGLVEPQRKPRPEPYFLDESELAQLLDYPHTKRDKALLYLLVDTGMRIGEAHSITVSDVKETWVHVNGKSGPRWVPVHKEVADMLRAIAPPSGPLWRGVRGPLTVSGMEYIVWKAFHRAGFIGDKMSAHRLRHTFCTLWEGSDSDGMAIVGHVDHATWRIYKHTRPKRLTAVHREHSPLAKIIRAA